MSRLYETFTLYILFNPPKLWKSEALGFFQDVLLCSGIFSLIFPIYRKLVQSKGQNKTYIFDILLVVFTIGNIGILEYFFYQMEPLDVFVFVHRPSEIAFSLNTSNLKFTRLVIALAFTAGILVTGLFYYKRFHIQSPHFKRFIQAGYFGLIVYAYFDWFGRLPVASDLIKNKSFYFYANILKDRTYKLFDPEFEKWLPKYQDEFPGKKYLSKEYSFLHEFESRNDLGDFIQKFDSNPNITILLTESLSEYFIHPIRGIQFMPFLDSLSKVSLYWPNHLSLGERSFAANPALCASVPYGEIGFSLLETYPYHFSLINVLQKNNYYTSFYYGQGSWFHNKNHFFSFNNIDRIIDKNSFNPSLKKVLIGEEMNFWGYNDIDLFDQYLMSTDSLIDKKRLDILFTGTSHAPFVVKDPEYYSIKFERAIKKLSNPEDIDHFNLYKRFYLTLYNVDDAYRQLFDKLKTRPDYQNTIFIITGDHAMTELPRFNALNPYKVPLIIYSPKLKTSQKFEAVCSHNDVYETILSYLQKEYKLNVPNVSTALGDKLKFKQEFDQNGTYIFMNNNRQIVDIYSDGYYLFKDKYLFKVYRDLEIKEIVDPIKLQHLREKLYSFRAASYKASNQIGLMPDSLYFQYMEQQIFAHEYLKDSTISLNTNYSITSSTVPSNKELTCDISMEVLSESVVFPKIHLELFDANHHLIESHELAYPVDKPNYQFHYKICTPQSISENLLLNISLIKSTDNTYSLRNLKYVIYGK